MKTYTFNSLFPALTYVDLAKFNRSLIDLDAILPLIHFDYLTIFLR